MALYGSLATLRAQAPHSAGFATAFAYVEELLRAGSPVARRIREVPVGESRKVDLGGGVFVMEQAYQTKLRPDGFFESHRNYIDVQVVAEGEELMELADISRIQVRQPYNAERDLIIFEDTPDAALLRMFPGLATIFFPSDVHMPSVRLRAEPVLVRKSVVKVPVNG